MKIDISQAHTYGVSDEAAMEFIEWRLSIKKPLTQRAFDSSMGVSLKCSLEFGMTPDEVLQLVIDCGWRGVVYEYIKRELANRKYAIQTMPVLANQESRGEFIQRVTSRDWAEH